MSAGARIDYQRSSLTTRGLLYLANGLVVALIRAACVAKHRQVVSLVTDMPAGGRRSAVVPVKRDQGVRPNSPAVRCRLRRRLIHQPTSPAVPSRLTSRRPCPICTTGPGRPEWPASSGVAPPAPPAAVSGGGPGDLLLVGDSVGQAAVQDTDQPVPESAERLVMGLAAGPMGVIAAPRTRGGGQRRERPQITGIDQPLITGRPGHHHRAQARGSGDRGSPSERLAALGRR